MFGVISLFVFFLVCFLIVAPFADVLFDAVGYITDNE